jgi:hypothetical protein
VAPTTIQPARQPPSCIASWARMGITTSPDICARVPNAVARVRRVTNQLLIAA